MGLAERFKEELKTKNIFEKSNIEKDLESQHIQFISKPIDSIVTEQEKETTIEQTIKEPNITDNNLCSTPKYEELETEIISKIRKTPYWEEFSIDRQKKMIEKYFEIKTKNSNISKDGKSEFIKNILILANNR